jgi:hypothetical protein
MVGGVSMRTPPGSPRGSIWYTRASSRAVLETVAAGMTAWRMARLNASCLALPPGLGARAGTCQWAGRGVREFVVTRWTSSPRMKPQLRMW